ncbi:MAG: substrate-binding domain-containing protein [Promethearchaeota archaeon]
MKYLNLLVASLTLCIIFVAPFAVLGQDGTEIAVINRDESSGTREFFYDFVMKETDFTSNIIEKNSNGAVHDAVRDTPAAIGYVGLGFLDDEIKAILLTEDGSQVEPNVANVRSGDYPIARNLNMITNGPPDAGVEEEFLNFVLSQEGQDLVAEEGFVPLEPQPWTKPSSLTGTLSIAGSTTVQPIAAVCAEEFMNQFPGVTITVAGGGSSTGVTSVGEDIVDIGMASRDIKTSEFDIYPDMMPVVVANDGIAIITNLANSLVELTLDEVKAIYNGTITTWEEVDGSILATPGFTFVMVFGALLALPVLKIARRQRKE